MARQFLVLTASVRLSSGPCRAGGAHPGLPVSAAPDAGLRCQRQTAALVGAPHKQKHLRAWRWRSRVRCDRRLCLCAGGARQDLPPGASPDAGLGYLPHNPALDAAMRELHSTMHRGAAGPAPVRAALLGF